MRGKADACAEARLGASLTVLVSQFGDVENATNSTYYLKGRQSIVVEMRVLLILGFLFVATELVARTPFLK